MELASLPEVPSLIERSRAIGADERLVVHGGGNTSCKTTGTDHLGRARRLLVIKASGTDLRGIGADGFVSLYLDEVESLRDRSAMTDEEMTVFLASARHDRGPRRPSIETLLHGFLPARHVDHVHADAICALTNGREPEMVVREALGDGIAFVAYRRPGFALSREVAEAASSARAVVLGHHGLVTWADTSDEALSLTRELVARADQYLLARLAAMAHPRESDLTPAEEERLLLALRARVSRHERRVLHVDRAARDLADRPDVARVIAAGPATADHLLRIRPFPVVLRCADDVDAVVDQAEDRGRRLWETYRDRVGADVAPRESIPPVAVVPGLGVVTNAADGAAANVVAEVARHSFGVAATVIDTLGDAVPLAPHDVFDLEYWPLELAKLRAPAGRDLDGRVFIVTGSASGIGRDIAAVLAKAGAHLVLADIDRDGLERTRASVAASGGQAIALTADVTSTPDVEALVHETIATFGGVDGVVSNAGVAVTGRIADLTDESWSRSLSVNATSHFLLARRTLSALAAQGLGGSLVFVASKNAFSPGEGFGAYSVAKAAEVQLARVVALEAGKIGVRANVVSPDAVFGGSRLWEGGMREKRAAAHGVAPADLEQFYARRSLLGLPVRGSDVAEAVLFCLSERSSRMTGCVLTVDAGVPAAFPR